MMAAGEGGIIACNGRSNRVSSCMILVCAFHVTSMFKPRTIVCRNRAITTGVEGW